MDAMFWFLLLPTGLCIWLTLITCVFILLRLGWLMLFDKPRF